MGEIIAAAGVGIAALIVVLWIPRWRKRKGESRRLRAMTRFRDERTRHEASFFSQAAASGTPRGLRWSRCDFGEAVTFAFDPPSRKLLALVGVTIAFEAIEGGPMEDVEAVSNLRAATAVFVYTQDGWQTSGSPLFNLDPAEAIERFHCELQIVEEPNVE